MTKNSPIVLLPGWGLGTGPLLGLAQQLGGQIYPLPGYPADPQHSPHLDDFSAACNVIAQQLPEQTVLCGWSLGGLLAQQIAATAPEKVSRLILISSTPSFVQRPDWIDATSLNELENFIDAVTENPSTACSQFVRGFNRGDKNSKAVTRALLETMSPLPDTAVLLTGLRWLRDIDLRAQAPSIHQPTLLLHGAHDPLMPVAGAQWFANALPQGRLMVLDDCAHAPFVSKLTALTACLHKWMEPAP